MELEMLITWGGPRAKCGNALHPFDPIRRYSNTRAMLEFGEALQIVRLLWIFPSLTLHNWSLQCSFQREN